MSDSADDALDELLETQRRYYDLRAPDYMNIRAPSDRKSRGLLSSDAVRRPITEFSPTGDVLEMACGSGAFTRELVHSAATLTCVDGSSEMLRLNAAVVGSSDVTYIEADLFSWDPPRRFDHVFFGFWLSHVPPTRFEDFWGLVDRCLVAGGRVGFVDEDHRGEANETRVSPGDVPTAERHLSDGRRFRIVKVFWAPSDLERRLQDSGWQAKVRPLESTCLFGTAERP